MININFLKSQGRGICPLNFRPHHWAVDSLSATAPGNFPSIRKNGKFPGVNPGGGGQGAVGID